MEATDNHRSNGRTAGGRFGPGNRFARGNPTNRRMAELRAVMLDAVTPETIAEAARRLGEFAARGNLTAIRLLFDYVVGKPVPGVLSLDPGLDLEHFKAVLIETLEPYPDARRALSAALRDWVESGQPPVVSVAEP